MSRSFEQFFPGHLVPHVIVLLLVFALAAGVSGAQEGQATPPKQPAAQAKKSASGKAFSSPDEAASALHNATKNNDEAALIGIFGPGAQEMVLWGDDPKERQEERAAFAQKYEQMHRLVNEPDGTVALYVGAENWPLPIPLVRINGAWYFDSGLGKKEILFRRIGRNELEALEVCHALVDAEKDYFAGMHSYASKFTSSAGTHDGLYWTGETGGKSPIGSYLAHAGIDGAGDANRAPFHGYYYRILRVRSASGSGDAQSNNEGGKTNRGFAILAFPAEYRSSGVVTFIMDQNGVAYEKDLGPMTEERAKQINSYDPDATWTAVEE